jgi:hypothetical protein
MSNDFAAPTASTGVFESKITVIFSGKRGGSQGGKRPCSNEGCCFTIDTQHDDTSKERVTFLENITGLLYYLSAVGASRWGCDGAAGM